MSRMARAMLRRCPRCGERSRATFRVEFDAHLCGDCHAAVRGGEPLRPDSTEIVPVPDQPEPVEEWIR